MTIAVDGRRIMASAGVNTITAALVEGTYPDFGRAIGGIQRHVENIIEEGELTAEGNLQKLQVTPNARPATLCSLDSRESMLQAARAARDLDIEAANADRLYWSINNQHATERAERRMSR